MQEYFGESTAVTQQKQDSLLSKMQKLGANDDDINQVEAAFNQQASVDVIVWPENRLGVMVFLACSTQWERHAMDGSFTRLNWNAIETAMRRHNEVRSLSQDEQDNLFWDVTSMERWSLNEQYVILQERKND